MEQIWLQVTENSASGILHKERWLFIFSITRRLKVGSHWLDSATSWMMSSRTRFPGSFPSTPLSMWPFYPHACGFIVTRCPSQLQTPWLLRQDKQGRMMHSCLVYSQEKRFPWNPADATGQNCNVATHSCKRDWENIYLVVSPCEVESSKGLGGWKCLQD